MAYACLIYGGYFILWFVFVFFNPWAQLRFFCLPLYFWLSCVFLPLFLCLFLGLKAYRRDEKAESLCKRVPAEETHHFFLGKNTSAFCLALSLAVSYISGSTFLAGPSMAMQVGFSWVLLASIQVPSLFLLTALLSKPFLALSKKFTFLNLLDFLKIRYPSRVLFITFTLLFSLSLLSMVVVQLMAAGRIMEGIFDLDYKLSLLLFLGIISFYTVLGGFRHVVLTDVLQAFLMLLFVIFLGVIIFYRLDGTQLNFFFQSKGNTFLSSHGGEQGLATGYLLSMWILLGIGLLGSPYMVNRLLSVQTSKQIPKINFWSTLFMTVLIIGIHSFAVLGSPFAEGLPNNDTAWILLTERLLGKGAKSLFAVAPLMAIMSSVDTLILIFASLVWSFFQDFSISMQCSCSRTISFKLFRNIIIGFITISVFILALYPPHFLVWLNLFVLALTQVIFFVPVFLGLFYHKGNILGVWLSLCFGLLAFIYWQFTFKGSTLFPHPILAGLVASLVAYLLGSLKKGNPEELRVQETFKETMKIVFLGKAQK